MANRRERPFGVILAGGLSRRMGGGDKGLIPLQGQPMLAHVIARLRPQVEELALNANGPPERFEAFGLKVLPDDLPQYPGPLAGVLAGMEWAASRGASHLLTAAADTPFFPQDLGSRLSKAGDFAIAASRDAEGALWQHPTFGLWPVALRQDLRQALLGGLRRLRDWTEAHGAVIVEFEGPSDPFFNVNTPEDLHIAEALAPSALRR